MSIKNIDVMDRLPGELAAILQADEYFSDIPVVTVEKGNVALEVARAQAVITTKGGKRGIAVIVPQLEADDEMPEVKFGPMALKCSFQVVENVELNNDANGTKKSYRKVARRIVQVIKATRLDGLTTDFKCDKPAIFPVPFKDDKKLVLGSVVGCQVNFVTHECDTEGLEQVSPPQIALAGQTFVITCPDDGAVIWFTTDDSIPMPTNLVSTSTAQVYTDPVAVPDAGVTVRAAAFLAGRIGSTISRAEIS